MPEQLDTVTHDSDISIAANWADQSATNWVAADEAVYVVRSDAKVGMDQPEFVPVADPVTAQALILSLYRAGSARRS
ncbi:MAG: nitrous oxide reductase accessory protein NosL [Candidatus Saccharibacteria bacterium]|nr:nitrous oxide reductase accessory protein NosL [Pseudorhodobacter sp.]